MKKKEPVGLKKYYAPEWEMKEGDECYYPYSIQEKAKEAKVVCGGRKSVTLLLKATVICIRSDGLWGQVEKDISEIVPVYTVFPHTYEGKKKCRMFAHMKFEEGFCEGCKYYQYALDANYKCRNCAHVKVKSYDQHGHVDQYMCGKEGTDANRLGFSPLNTFTICKHFEPALDGDKKTYKGWENHVDFLEHCEHNPNCPHHAFSVWKAMPYDEWLHSRDCIWLNVGTIYNGEKYSQVCISNEDFMNNDMLVDGDKIKAQIVRRMKKKTQRGRMVSELTTVDEGYPKIVEDEEK